MNYSMVSATLQKTARLQPPAIKVAALFTLLSGVIHALLKGFSLCDLTMRGFQN